MNAHSRAVASVTHAKQSNGSGDHYRADIDGLRGIAVLAVIGFHAYPEYFPGGFVGVDVFFVISGFLISSIILRQIRQSRFRLADFYARRVRRIFPALILVLPACLLFGWFVLLPDELEHLGKHTAAASAFVSNFALWRESGYFDPAAELKPLLHLWSLGIEEQFYVLWPLTLLLLWKRQQNITTTIVVLTLASFGMSVALGHDKPIAGFYLPLSRFWELGLGCLLATIKEFPESATRRFGNPDLFGRYDHAVRSRLRTALPVVGICLIAASIFLFDRDTAFPGWATLLPTAGAMCVICVPGDSWFQRRILASAAMVFVGIISYPLYLWHWPLLSFATILEAGTPESLTRLTAVLISFVLAWLTFRFLERPVRAQRSARVTFSVVGALCISGLAGWVIYSASGFDARFDHDVRALRPEPPVNSLCRDQVPQEVDFNYCKSTSSARPLAVFLGDSRAQAVYEGVAAEIGTRYPMTLLARGGCPPLLNVPGANEQGCNDVWNHFVRYVEQSKPPVVVVVGGGSPLLRGPTAALAVQGIPFPIADETFKAGLGTLIVALQKTSRVIYVREIPQYDSAPSCFLRPVRIPWSHCSPSIARGSVEHEMASYNRIVDEVETEIPGLWVVDSISALCDADLCSQKSRSGEILYTDRLHLSPAGGRHFAKASGLSSIVLEPIYVSAALRWSTVATSVW